MQFSLTWYTLLRSVLDHCWFGNASASILLVVSLRLCISQLFCPDLACIHSFRPGQWTLSCTAAKRGTTSTLIQMSHHSQLMEILVFLSIQMLYYFFNSLLCYKSNPIVLRAVQTQKMEKKKWRNLILYVVTSSQSLEFCTYFKVSSSLFPHY